MCFESPVSQGDGHGGVFDRQGKVSCSDFSFRQNEPLTVFSFSHPNWATDLNVFPQHTILFAHFKPEAIRHCDGSEEEHGDDGDAMLRWELVQGKETDALKSMKVACLSEGSHAYQWYVDRGGEYQSSGIWDLKSGRYEYPRKCPHRVIKEYDAVQGVMHDPQRDPRV